MLWFSDRNFLNDSSEGTYVLDLLHDNIVTICQGDITMIKGLKDKCKQRKSKVINERFHTYQCSFSIDKDSLVLWNYYTKGESIKGYNIQFNVNDLIDSLTPTIPLYHESVLKPIYAKVLYIEDEQIEILKKITALYIKLAKNILKK